MEQHPLPQLVHELTQLIAHAGLKLQTLADHYILHRTRTRPSSNLPQQIQLQGFKNITLYGSENIPIKANQQQEQEALREAFHLYLVQNKNTIHRLFPHFTYDQIVTKAAQQFRELSQIQKLQYLRYPNFVPIQSLKNRDAFGTISLYSHNCMAPSRTLLSTGSLSTERGQRGNIDSYKRQNEEAADKYNRSFQTPNFERRAEEKDPNSKNDIYRMILVGKSGQRQEKITNRGDQAKEKTQFQTLKSLFKKLQNNT